MDVRDKYNVIGVMSGTSLDGLDIALCNFQVREDTWDFFIEKGITYAYSGEWKSKLASSEALSGYQLMLLHNEFGKFIGERVGEFLEDTDAPVDLIASHGHTIFHQPSLGLTLQIGNGASIAAITGISTVCDFRSLDVALGGQGAPLVPVGDKLLFPDYDYCLNLGGFANVSFDDPQGRRIAFDICPANVLLNHYAGEKGAGFDVNGEIGRKGEVCDDLLNELNQLVYYKLSGPRSLGREWVWENIVPIIGRYHLSTEDKMNTIYHHIAFQISRTLDGGLNKRMLITGGGAWNKFLIDLIKGKVATTIEIPLKNIVDFKEALIFAFLGLLRYRGEDNCLCSVTGASRNSSSGAVYNMARPDKNKVR